MTCVILPLTHQVLVAWREGDRAHLEGLPSSANPYPPETSSSEAWLRGYHGWPADERGGFTTT